MVRNFGEFVRNRKLDWKLRLHIPLKSTNGKIERG